MRVAIFEVSHWRFPLYAEALSESGVRVAGVSDRERFAGGKYAAKFGCSLHPRWTTLIDAGGFDFALVFGRHADMPVIAQTLAERGIPFLIESPCGVRAEDIVKMRRAAEGQKLFVAVPFVLRVSDLLREIAGLGLAPEGYRHFTFRFIDGPISRYEGSGCSWMLRKEEAGGGAMMNLGMHFVDLFAALTRSPPRSVVGVMNRFRPDVTVEEHGVLTVVNERGQTAVVEAGYTCPSAQDEPRGFSFSIGHAAADIRGSGGRIHLGDPAIPSTRAVEVRLDPDVHHPNFLRRMFDDFKRGRAPVAGLAEVEAAIRVVETGYRSADAGSKSLQIL